MASYAHWGAEEIEIIEPLAREGYEELLLMQILDQFFMEEKVIAIRAADVFLGIPQERIPSDARSDKVQTMIRITDIEALLKKMTMKSAGEMIIRILDPMIPENSGMWQWKSDGHKSQVSRYQGVREPEVTMDIRDFTEYLFREREIFFNEVV